MINRREQIIRGRWLIVGGQNTIKLIYKEGNIITSSRKRCSKILVEDVPSTKHLGGCTL